MNLRDLHYFVVLAEVQHFGEASRRCHVSQPTLSMQIKKLEEELGLVLFERNNKSVLLTDQGRLLVVRAQRVLTEVEQMKELARASRDPFAGEIKLGIIPTLAPYLLPLIMPAIQEAFPKLRLWLIEERTDQLTDKLTTGQIDAAIMATPANQFEHHSLFNEPFYFACSIKSPLSAHATIKLEQLTGQPVMLLEEGHCLRQQAMAICQSSKMESQADFTATSLETLRLMVESDLGVTLLPALAVERKNSTLQVIPFAPPTPYRSVALYWRHNTAKLICLQALGKLISTRAEVFLKGLESY